MRLPNAALGLPLRPLAAAFALALAIDGNAVAPAHATPRRPDAIVVQNCDDAGAGSLRAAVDSAADGDTIDLTQLQCSTISLSTGAILIGVADLTLQGPGNHQLTLDGVDDYGWSLLYDIGGGTLAIDGLDLDHSGPHVGEEHRGVGGGDEVSELDDEGSVEGSTRLSHG